MYSLFCGFYVPLLLQVLCIVLCLIMAQTGGYLSWHPYIVHHSILKRETADVCWKTFLSLYPLQLTNATRIRRLRWLQWRVSMEKLFISHGCRSPRSCLWHFRVNIVLHTLQCAFQFMDTICVNFWVFPYVCVSCNSRGWMEDRLSGSQGRVDRLLKTVERDPTASAHAKSQNRHTVLVSVIAIDRQPSECPLSVAIALKCSQNHFKFS